MRTPADTAKHYLAAWNGPSFEERMASLDGWAPDASYVDPLMSATGRDAIERMIEVARALFPGHAFRLRGMPDGHGPYVRFSWTLEAATGEPVAFGTDVVHLDDQGRIKQVLGFLDGAAA